jgi:ABC-type sugar transport system permease subunit
MKISKWTLLWLVIVLALMIVWGSMLAGLWRATDLALNFFLIIFSLVVIAILAIIGAVFVGIFVSHRIISARDARDEGGCEVDQGEDVGD